MNDPSGKLKSPIPAPLFHICRILLGLIFLIASLDKISQPWNFGRAIYAYQFLPGILISPFAIILPWVELTSGILMILNKYVRASAILIGGMNISFIIAIFSVIIRGIEVECGCGLDVGPLAAVIGTQADWLAIVRDMVFLGMALIVYVGAIHGKSQGGK